MSPLPRLLQHHTKPTVLTIGLGFAFAFTGCVSTYQEPRRGHQHERAVVQVVVQDSYVYYPEYEIYYNSTQRQYVYLEGNVWVTRRDPPRQWVSQLRVAPSVTLDFHDAPQRHHAEVVRVHPRSQKQPQRKNDHGRHDEEKERNDNQR